MVPSGIIHHLYKQPDKNYKTAGNNPVKIFSSVLSHYINWNTNLLNIIAMLLQQIILECAP